MRTTTTAAGIATLALTTMLLTGCTTSQPAADGSTAPHSRTASPTAEATTGRAGGTASATPGGADAAGSGSATGTTGSGTTGSGTTGPGTTASGTTTASGASTTGLFPPGQPPRPGPEGSITWSTSVPGLTAAVAAAPHPGLQICGNAIGTIVASASDMRGTGTTQYLVDTTCQGATATSPDEVAIYEKQGATLTRTAVVYEFTANRPRLTAMPYLFGAHTVVLTFDDGATYRLVRILPDRIVPGLVARFS